MKINTFNKLRKLIYNECGIYITDKKEILLSARISKRIRKLSLNSPEEYLEYLEENIDGNEIIEFLDVISTNTTHFFREKSHFEFMEEVFRKWLDENEKEFTLWSVASSTGEEPYSIAMTLDDLTSTCKVNIRILATDISTKVLRFAKTGKYSSKKIEKIPKKYLKKFFIYNKRNDEYEVINRLKKMISFNRLNLSKPPFPMSGPFDMIFCRNVMIYFDNRVRERLINDIYRLLKPGGYLLIGHAESLLNINTNFKSLIPSIYYKGS